MTEPRTDHAETSRWLTVVANSGSVTPGQAEKLRRAAAALDALLAERDAARETAEAGHRSLDRWQARHAEENRKRKAAEATLTRIRDALELVPLDDVRSSECVDPARCGKHGWRLCDRCSELQDRISDARADLDGPKED